MLLTVLAVAGFLGAVASFPLLRWARRLDRRRLAAIEDGSSLWLAALLLPTTWALLANHSPLALDLFGPLAIYCAFAAAAMARVLGMPHWRIGLYGATAVILIALLADLSEKHG